MKTKIETKEAITRVRNAKSVEEIRNVILNSDIKGVRREYKDGNPYIVMDMSDGSLCYNYNNNMPDIIL